jgi:hypothetical protein
MAVTRERAIRMRFMLGFISLERKMDQQEEAEGAEEERRAGIVEFTWQGGMEVLHDRVQRMDSLRSLLPPVQMHFGFQDQGFSSRGAE